MKRRTFLTTFATAAAASAIHTGCAKSKTADGGRLPIGLNCGTLNGYKLPLEKQVELVSQAGYDGIEPWTRDIEEYFSRGKKLSDAKKLFEDVNLKVCNLIGFAKCMSDDSNERAKGLEQMKREIEWAAGIGSKNIACTMLGVEKLDPQKFDEYAARYRAVIEIATPCGVKPLLELWGHRALHKLGDALDIAARTGSERAGLLLDFYHLYRGGNSFDSLALLNLADMDVFHIDDYPANPPREKLADADRIFPTEGICPFGEILPKMKKQGFKGCLSLEIFNKKYWATYQPEELLKIGLQKIKAIA